MDTLETVPPYPLGVQMIEKYGADGVRGDWQVDTVMIDNYDELHEYLLSLREKGSSRINLNMLCYIVGREKYGNLDLEQKKLIDIGPIGEKYFANDYERVSKAIWGRIDSGMYDRSQEGLARICLMCASTESRYDAGQIDYFVEFCRDAGISSEFLLENVVSIVWDNFK